MKIITLLIVLSYNYSPNQWYSLQWRLSVLKLQLHEFYMAFDLTNLQLGRTKLPY